MKQPKGTKANVLYVESCQDGTIGGSHYCLLQMVKNLDRSKYEPIVIFYEMHSLLSQFQAVAETVVWPTSSGRAVRWGVGRSWVFFPLVIARRIVNSIKLVSTIPKCVSFLYRNEVNLVHLNNSITRGHDWMYAAGLMGIPCVVSERGLNPKYSVRDRAWARRFAAIIPMSQWIMNHMVDRGVSPRNIRVIYDGLDPDRVIIERPQEVIRSLYKIKSNQPVIGIVGNIREWKGQETVVRAVVEVSKVYGDVVCFFVGTATPNDKPYVDRMYALIKEAGIEANVRFTGYQADPASFVNVMSLVIHASTQPEPFGMVVLEAMAQRKPVLGTRAGGIIEMVVEGETGCTFPPGDVGMLSARIIELLSNPTRANKMGEAGYERVMSSFTLQRYMDNIHSLYEAVLSNHALPLDVGIRPSSTANGLSW